MPCVRKSFGKQFNLSSGVLDLIMKSWSEGTAKQYAPHLRSWFNFRSKNGPLNANVTSCAEFLAQYFRKSSFEYSSVNAARSAFSSILPAVNGFTSGEQHLIKRLLQAMFKERPTFPCYTVTYNVRYVLDYVKECSISSETSLELTSKILATMMYPLVSLPIDCMYLNNSGRVFYISKLLKTSRPKSHQQPVEFKAYPHDVSRCANALIKLYLDKTAAPRHDVKSMFFISYAPPHKAVSSRTLARWVSDILHKAGIHTKTFKSYSLSSVSTSNAFSGGLFLTEIVKTAGWTNVKTFAKFYNKAVIDNNFGNFLLTNSLHIFMYCMLRIGVCKIWVVSYIPIWALKSHMNTCQGVGTD